MDVKIQNIVNGNAGCKSQFRETTTKNRYTLGDALPDISTLSIVSPMPPAKSYPPAHDTASSAKATLHLKGYSIRPLEKQDQNAAMHHLRSSFFMDEPLNIDVGLLKDKSDRCFELEEYALGSMQEGHSLLAVSDSGDIVGVCLNHISERDDVDTEDPSMSCSNTKFRKILSLIHIVSERADIFRSFPDVRSVMSVSILSVDGNMRGRGIAKELMKRSRDLAKEERVQMMRVDCTSHYSARVAASLGYNCIYELSYNEFLEDGAPVFTPNEPHTKATVYVLRIES